MSASTSARCSAWLLESPMNTVPLSKLGTALVRPAPPTLIDPADAWDRMTLPMFCSLAVAPVGLVAVSAPAVVDTYSSSPAEYAEVSISYTVPKVTTLTFALRFASVSAIPNAGIFAASSASAFITTGLLPLTPDT